MNDKKLMLQLILSALLVVAGIVLLFVGMFIDPQGEIHNSVLVAFGESLTFVGAVFGIDYSYKYKHYKADKDNELRLNKPE